ncbi:MAG: hypothetical protein ACQEP8_00825 [Chlamydiota bacterium]
MIGEVNNDPYNLRSYQPAAPAANDSATWEARTVSRNPDNPTATKANNKVLPLLRWVNDIVLDKWAFNALQAFDKHIVTPLSSLKNRITRLANRIFNIKQNKLKHKEIQKQLQETTPHPQLEDWIREEALPKKLRQQCAQSVAKHFLEKPSKELLDGLRAAFSNHILTSSQQEDFAKRVFSLEAKNPDAKDLKSKVLQNLLRFGSLSPETQRKAAQALVDTMLADIINGTPSHKSLSDLGEALVHSTNTDHEAIKILARAASYYSDNDYKEYHKLSSDRKAAIAPALAWLDQHRGFKPSS